MSKELEALEKIRMFEPFGYDRTNKEEYALDGTLNDYLEDELNIIKKALKEYERFVNNVNATLEELRDTSENIKANVMSVSPRMRFYADVLDDVISLIEGDIADLEGGAMNFVGSTLTAVSDGSTTGTITISDGGTGTTSYSAKAGDVVLYDNKEFVWKGAAWEELGDKLYKSKSIKQIKEVAK